MRGTRAAAAVAIAGLTLAAGAATADARAPHPNCYPKSSYGYAKSPRARLFDVQRGEGTALYACDLVTGRRTQIDSTRDTDESYRVTAIRFAGRIAAFRLEHSIKGITAHHTVIAIDVKTRRRRGGPSEQILTDLVVSHTGSVAWAGFGPGRRHVWADSGGRARMVDSGPGIEAGSLALSSRSDLYWTKDGLPASARLDEQPPAEDAPPSQAVGGHRGCQPRGRSEYDASDRGLIFDQASGDDLAFYACNLKTGRRALITEIDDAEEDFGFHEIAFAGWYVAYAARGCIKVDCGGGRIGTVDLRTGAVRGVRGGEGGPLETTDLVLEPDGSVAWITAYNPGPANRTTVRACSPTTCRDLDSGEGVERRSLGLASNGRLYWTGLAGLPRSAPID